MFYFSHNLTDLQLISVSVVLDFIQRWCLFVHQPSCFKVHSFRLLNTRFNSWHFCNPIINFYLIYHAHYSLINWNWILNFKVSAWELSQNVCPQCTQDSFVRIVARLHAGQIWSQDIIPCKDDIALFHCVQTSSVVYATSSSVSSRWLFPEK